MKQLTLLILAIVFSSCCNAKQVIENSSKKNSKIEAESKAEVEVENETKIKLPPKPTKLIKNNTTEAFNHNWWNKVLQKYVSKTGNVNYKAIKNNPTELHVYIDALSESMPNNSWTKEDKLAYWINAYNALTVDLIIKNYPVKSIKDIKNPWNQRLWQLGKKWYNLNEIEHQILRKMNEPRIHFAIVCASFSCPKLQNEAFTALTLETQLTAATKEFLADKNRNNITENNLELSKIFKWFSKDFKQNGGLIYFLNQYSDVQISTNAKSSFKDYNWNLND